MVYCGNRRTTFGVLKELLWLTAVSIAYETGSDMYVHVINQTGRSLLARPELEPEVKAALAGRRSFSIIDNHVVFI